MTSLADRIAARTAIHLLEGEVVNLGIGIPTLVAEYLRGTPGVIVQTENGMLGVGPRPAPGEEDPNLVNAGKLPVTELAGAAYFSSAESFAMIRGGHIDVAVLGVLQVDARGRIANWASPGRPILGVGGAMDLLVGARRVVVATTHVTRAGAPKIVSACEFPLTSDRAVNLIVTDHATFEVDAYGLTLIEVAPESSLDWVARHTTASYRTAIT
jgi:3-oxoacid CoA-transferase B subunit